MIYKYNYNYNFSNDIFKGAFNVNNDNGCHGVEGEYDRIELVGGEKYFIAAIHHQRSNSAENNFLRISMKTSKSSVSHEQHPWVTDFFVKSI